MSDPLREIAIEIYVRAVTNDVLVRAMRGEGAGEIDYKRLTEEAWRAAKAFSKCSHEGASSIPVDVAVGAHSPSH